MNILIPYSWLKEYLDTQASAQKVAECLSLCSCSVEKIIKKDGDSIFEIEITTNRVDMMSILGIAREAGAVLNQFGIKSKFKLDPYKQITNSKHQTNKQINNLKITIEDKKKLCQRILGVVIDNVKLAESPKIIKERLNKVGLRPLNNAIDITNYLMLEFGHPVHVFDYDRLTTKKLIIREAKKGEKLITFDKNLAYLQGGEVVIDNGEGEIIDLPGIIGTANSVVTKNTKRVFLFIESNNPIKIRTTSMALGIRTMAATLNEKGVDPKLGKITLEKGIVLFEKICKANQASKIYDLNWKAEKEKEINLPLNLIEQYLGMAMQPNKVEKILTSLGFTINKQLASNKKHRALTVTVPSWRNNDIKIPEDLIEEVARIYGYHNLESKIMAGSLPLNQMVNNFAFEDKLKDILIGFGLTELYTNSLVSQHLAKDSNFPLIKHLKIKNVLSDEWVYLRTSLIPSHLQALENNPKKIISIFEIAKIYQPKNLSLPLEKKELLITTTKDYFYLKGLVEALGKALHVQFEFKKKEDLDPLYLEEYPFYVKDNLVGVIGKLKLKDNFCYQEVFTLLLDPVVLAKWQRDYPLFQKISIYPPVIEDLTFILSPRISYQQLLQLISRIDHLVCKVELKTSYQNTLTFTIYYQDLNQNLSNEKVSLIRSKIVRAIEDRNWGQLKGEVKL